MDKDTEKKIRIVYFLIGLRFVIELIATVAILGGQSTPGRFVMGVVVLVFIELTLGLKTCVIRNGIEPSIDCELNEIISDEEGYRCDKYLNILKGKLIWTILLDWVITLVIGMMVFFHFLDTTGLTHSSNPFFEDMFPIGFLGLVICLILKAVLSLGGDYYEKCRKLRKIIWQNIYNNRDKIEVEEQARLESEAGTWLRGPICPVCLEGLDDDHPWKGDPDGAQQHLACDCNEAFPILERAPSILNSQIIWGYACKTCDTHFDSVESMLRHINWHRDYDQFLKAGVTIDGGLFHRNEENQLAVLRSGHVELVKVGSYNYDYLLKEYGAEYLKWLTRWWAMKNESEKGGNRAKIADSYMPFISERGCLLAKLLMLLEPDVRNEVLSKDIRDEAPKSIERPEQFDEYVLRMKVIHPELYRDD